MKLSDAFPSKHISASDLNGQSVRVTIDRYEIEEIGQKKDRKPVIYFRGKSKGLVLNKTNGNNIALMHGSDLDDWVGCEIELFPSVTDFQGETVDCVRCKPVHAKAAASPQRQVVTERTPPPVPLDDDVPF